MYSLKALTTMLSSIVRAVIERFQFIKAAIGAIKDFILFLVLDAALTHLSLALTGFALRRERLKKKPLRGVSFPPTLFKISIQTRLRHCIWDSVPVELKLCRVNLMLEGAALQLYLSGLN
ncbi:MAG: hypothetical protein ACP5K1_00835 [Candidatus Bathyarchaeia archaeon]